MPDGRLEFEISFEGTQQAARGLNDVAQAQNRVVSGTRPMTMGLDEVAKAEKSVRDSSYSARQAHENWVAGYRSEVFTEQAEKIKRISHVTRETNPNLKWMGEGFKAAGKDAHNAGTQINQLRSVTVSASSASLAYTRIMAGDFVGAARAAGMAVKSLWAVMLANPFTAMLAGIAAAVAGLKMLMDWHDSAKQKAREHAREISELGDELNAVLYGSVSENVSKNAQRMVQSGDRAGLEKGIDSREKANAQLRDQALALKEAIGNMAVGGFGAEKEQRVKDEMVAQYKDVIAQMRENKATIAEYRSGIAELDKPKSEPGSGGGPTGSGADSAFENAEQKRRQLDREKDLAQTADPLARAYREKAMLGVDRKGLESDGSAESKLKIVAIDRQIWELEKQITSEIERRSSARSKEEDVLKVRMEEYRLSKLTKEEQLAAVNAKISALRGSTNQPTTAQKSQMLDLVQQRDSLMADMANDNSPAGDDADGPIRAGGRTPWKPGSGFSSRLNKSRLAGAGKSFASHLRGSAFRSTARNDDGVVMRERTDETVNVKGVDKMIDYLRGIKEQVS